MRLPFYFFKGDPEKFAIIFIHGLGMDSSIWTSPSETKIFGNLFPLNMFIRQSPQVLILKEKPLVLPEKFTTGIKTSLNTSFNDLKEKGYTVLTWTQKKPLKSIHYAIEELEYMVHFTSLLTEKGIILIGHSRGGLIARKFVENHNKNIKAVITIATPHKGSTIAEWTKYISIISNLLKPFLKIFPERIEKAFEKIAYFLKSESVIELLPNSDFIKSLKKTNMELFCIGGQNPNLFNIYQWRLRENSEFFKLSAEKIFSFPEALTSHLPQKLIPSEWLKGDGLVSVESSLVDGKVGRIFNLNHAEIIVNYETKKYILEIIESLQ